MLNPVLSAVALLLLLTAAKAQPVTVRLAGGAYPQEGRLELHYNGTWGTVCDDGFNDAAASVVCYSLEFGRSGGVFIGNSYGRGTGPIWLDSVQCNGTERSIADCHHSGWGVHDCGHAEDVSVSCIIVRLVGGPSPREGRLEVYYNGAWGTVCDDHFDNAAARVVCYMLGHVHVGKFIGNRYGAGSGTIWLTNVQCSGTETSIAYCQRSPWGNHNCWHSEDVSVSCITEKVRVRLVGGNSPGAGRLEVQYNDAWGTVCDDGFTDATARVVCYSLGFGYVGRMTNTDTYGIGNGRIWLDDVECNGTEGHIGECSHQGWGVHDCTHSEDVAISCLPETSTTPISSSSSPTTGGGPPATGKPTTAVFSSSLAAVGGPPPADTTPVSSSATSTKTVSSSSSPTAVRGPPATPEISSSSVATVDGPLVTSTTPVSSSSSPATDSSVSNSPTSQSTTPPTSVDNSTASVKGGNDYAILIIVVVGLVALMIFFCIGMTYCCWLRNRMREHKQQAVTAISLQETSSDMDRPPPTAPSFPDDPPPYSSKPDPGSEV